MCACKVSACKAKLAKPLQPAVGTVTRSGPCFISLLACPHGLNLGSGAAKLEWLLAQLSPSASCFESTRAGATSWRVFPAALVAECVSLSVVSGSL